jgi:hypothetical protein
MVHFVICPSIFRMYTYSIHFLSRFPYCTSILYFFPFWLCQRSLEIPPSFTVDPLSFQANCCHTYILYIHLNCISSLPNSYPTVYYPNQTLTLLYIYPTQLYILPTQLYILPPKHSLYYILSLPSLRQVLRGSYSQSLYDLIGFWSLIHSNYIQQSEIGPYRSTVGSLFRNFFPLFTISHQVHYQTHLGIISESYF